MRLAYSSKLKEDLTRSVSSALSAQGIVNLPVLAEQIRQRNEVENIALEDIEQMVMETAKLLGAAIEFDTRSQ